MARPRKPALPPTAGIDWSTPGVFRCTGCGASSNKFTVPLGEPASRGRVEGCTCPKDEAKP